MTRAAAWQMTWIALILAGWASEAVCQPVPAPPVNCGTYVLIPPGDLELIEPRHRAEGIISIEPTSALGTHARIPHSLLVKRTEVTQAEWAAVMGSNPSSAQSCGLDCPVELVSWYDAISFVNRLSRREGLEPCYEMVDCIGAPGSGCTGDFFRACQFDAQTFVCRDVYLIRETCTGYRLPTEAEWEYAYRAGGPATDYYSGDTTVSEWYEHDPALDSIAWYLHNSDHPDEIETPWPVARKTPNAWGLYDMSGNVEEWAFDGYPGVSMGPHAVSPEVQRLLELMWSRSVRGCDFLNSAINCHHTKRIYIASGLRSTSIGLRPVRTMPVHMCPQSLPPLVPSSLPEQHF